MEKIKALIVFEEIPESLRLFSVECTPEEAELLKQADTKIGNIDDWNDGLMFIMDAIADPKNREFCFNPKAPYCGKWHDCQIHKTGDYSKPFFFNMIINTGLAL